MRYHLAVMAGTHPVKYLLCGASNLRFLWPVLAGRLLAEQTGRVYVACGIGRSYRKTAGVSWLRCPCIGGSGVLEEFAADPAAAGAVLVMDMGNDFFYGFDGPGTVSPLVTMIRRWQQAGVPVVLVPPAVTSGEITPRQFEMVRRIFYPGCEVPLADVEQALTYTRERLGRLNGPGLYRVEGWAGLLSVDRIHVSPGNWPRAAERLLTALDREPGKPVGLVETIRALWQTRTFTPFRYKSWNRIYRGRGRYPLGSAREVILY